MCIRDRWLDSSNSVMNTIRFALVIGLATATLLCGWTQDTETVKKDLARIQGEWSMVSGSADGQSMQDDLRKEMKRVCKGNETTTTMGDQVFMKAKFTIDPT